MVGDATPVMNDLLTVPSFTLSGPESGTGALALERDRTLGTNQTFIISEDFSLTGITFVPEPSAMCIGVAGVAYRKRSTKNYIRSPDCLMITLSLQVPIECD